MQSSVEGIVLNDTLYGDSSKILKILTKEYGLISVIAKGARTYKNKLRMLSTPFLYGKFNIIYKKDKLSILCSGEAYSLYTPKNDLKLYAYLSYITELTYNVLLENNNKEIFNIYKAALDKLFDGFDYNIIRNIVEFKYLDYLGITPNFDICQKCYSSENLCAIDGKIGGFVCSKCYKNEIIVPDNFKLLLNRYKNVNITEINKINKSDKNTNLVNVFINDYYDTFSSLKIKSKNYMETFN